MNQDQKYISLQEASNHCNYSQEYLSLRARQGKLKSVKNGRNWITTLEWVQNYIKDTEVVKAEIEKTKEAKLMNIIEQKIPVKIIEKAKIESVPKNLPSKNYFIPDYKKLNTKTSPILLLSAFIILFFSSIIFGKDSIAQSLNNFNVASQITGSAGDYFINKSTSGIEETISSLMFLKKIAIENISEKFAQASLAVVLPNNVSSKNSVSGTQNLIQENISDINKIDRLEMKDQSTGVIYCTWIEDGWWVKVQSACKDVTQKNFSGE